MALLPATSWQWSYGPRPDDDAPFSASPSNGCLNPVCPCVEMTIIPTSRSRARRTSSKSSPCPGSIDAAPEGLAAGPNALVGVGAPGVLARDPVLLLRGPAQSLVDGVQANVDRTGTSPSRAAIRTATASAASTCACGVTVPVGDAKEWKSLDNAYAGTVK